MLISKIRLNDEEAPRDVAKIFEEKSSIIYINHFDEEAVKSFYTDFNKLIRNQMSIIPIVIDSYGGYIDSLIAMMDIISSSPVHVATICIGKAMSCGSVLLTCGTKGMRFIAPHARVMIHHASSMSWGKQPEMEVNSEELKRLQEVIFNEMAKNCGKKKNYFLDLLAKKGNTDLYLTPQECKKHGIVDHIKVPSFQVDISVTNYLM